MNIVERLYLWLRDRVSKPGERGMSSAGYWQNLLRENVLARLDKARGRLLEIGCGEGLFLEQLSRRNPKLGLFGIEREGLVLSDTRRRLSDNIKLVSSEAGCLAFKEASFEWAAGVNLFICIESREVLAAILKEASRVLKPGGKLIIEFRNKGNIFLKLKYGLARFYDSTTEKHPLSTYYKEDVLRILADTGFSVGKIEKMDFPFRGLAAIFILEAVRL